MVQEQIQRLRESVTTCYNAVSSKNGVIPEEVGDFTVRNLPEAIESIPTSNCVLTELEVTANGEYLPANYDADGFSKVTARFDTSSLPKIKLSLFSVKDDCINEEGRWEGEGLIDTSNVSNFQTAFQNNKAIKTLDASIWDTSSVIRMRWMFSGCTNLQYIDATGWDISKIESSEQGLQGCFRDCPSLSQIVGIEDWITAENNVQCVELFSTCASLKSLDLSNWRIRPTNLLATFKGCKQLEMLDISNFITDDCTTLNSMLYNTPNLKSVDLTKWKAGKVSDMWNFIGGSGISSLVGDRTYDQVVNDNITILGDKNQF